VDANEGWNESNLMDNLAACQKAGVEMIEQPLPATSDHILKNFKSPIILCADESIHDTASLEHVVDRYQAINIKLDKTGGLTEAIRLLNQAEKARLSIMIGCMVGTSLAMAPAFLLASRARWVDLDAPLLLAQDHPDGFSFSGSVMHPLSKLWGIPNA
jgi:L-alanine-DL-glutamate epimerase-like enolase superfamily enzyme